MVFSEFSGIDRDHKSVPAETTPDDPCDRHSRSTPTRPPGCDCRKSSGCNPSRNDSILTGCTHPTKAFTPAAWGLDGWVPPGAWRA